MLLRGTIESVYKGTLVYACEHNPSDVTTCEYNGSVCTEPPNPLIIILKIKLQTGFG